MIIKIQRGCMIGYFLIVGFLFVPNLSFAEGVVGTCSESGYTVVTMNGVFTDEDGAKKNKEALELRLDREYHGENLKVDYLHNPSHLGGIGDVAKVVYQKIFDNETVEDYDLIEMLKSASEKVKTQKLLLVAHSQGNFYANSFYDIVSGKDGGVPMESISVYSVATPAGRVAGGGKWLTSDTDKIIADIVGRMPFKKIMSPNTHIELQNGDDANGHNFSGVYLKYRGKEIVSDIKNSLDKLKIDNTKDPQKNCIEPPKLTLAHKITGAVFTVADPVAETGIVAAVFAGTASAKATVWTYDIAANAAKTGAKATVWTYATGATVVKTVAQVAVTTASSITATAKSLVNEVANLAGNNSAAVITTQKSAISPTNIVVANKQNVSAPALAIDRQTIAKPPITLTVINTASASEPPERLIALTEKSPPPKLVFVGLRMLGGGASSQVTPQKIEDVEIESETEEELSAPTLSITQCDRSLATDGCLLATTTINFSWTTVSGADYYAINKNGEYATTTELFFGATIADFSDYTFGVSAISSDITSATSTKTISVATIPIAINEIAWMGTRASTFDEWLELKNNTGHTINLSQWAIESKDGAPRIALSGSIAPREYLVLERRANTIIVDSAVLTYGNGSSEWALGNGGEELALLYSGTTFDSTPAIISDVWSAGVSSGRKTMERYASKESGADILNWGTNLGYIKNGKDADGNYIKGTPGERNSVSFLINKGRDITENLTLTVDDGSFVVPNKILLTASSTLTVEPGVEISIYKDSYYGADGSFQIEGVIDARGTAENPIVINSFSGDQTGGIWFDNATGTSTLDFIRIEDTNNIGLSNSRIEIRNSDFVNTDGGINAYASSSVIIANTRFTNLTDDAVGAYNGSVINIASTTINGVSDGDGIGAYSGSVVNIASTTISNIGSYGNGVIVSNSTLVIASSSIKNISSGEGLSANSNSKVTIISTTIDGISDGDGVAIYNSTLIVASSTIKNISDDGVRLINSTSTISNTLIQNGGANGIDVYGGTANITDTTVSGFTEGAGITVDSPKSPVAVTGGEITGNAVGVSAEPAESVILTDVSVHDNATP